MTGKEFIARAIATGSLFGSGVGSSLEELDHVIPLSHMDDVTGRRDSRTLRRDYGLFEVTCSGAPNWRCQAFSLEIHRLLHLPELRSEVAALLGIRFEQITTWTDVQRAYERVPGSGTLEVLDESPGYRLFQERLTGVTVHVVHDPSALRGDFPGHGDVWSLGITSPAFLR
ncbi:hypothetical protein [Streptomyces griseoluteus]|uniref:hypothetical protein n=1 Tax=Streptomyces griseoluteus TaxID=29306 RepID=UPI0036C801C1